MLDKLELLYDQLTKLTPAQLKADTLYVIGIAGAVGFTMDGDLSNGLASVVIASVTLAKAIGYVSDLLKHKNVAEVEKAKVVLPTD